MSDLSNAAAPPPSAVGDNSGFNRSSQCSPLSSPPDSGSPGQTVEATQNASIQGRGRALVPNVSLAALPAGQRALPTVSPPQDESGPSPMATGPASKAHTVPSRPKPGRKPATDTPPNKRKCQNRTSQRNFRARREEKFKALESELQALKNTHQQEMSRFSRTVHELQNENLQLRNEILQLRTATGQQNGLPPTPGYNNSMPLYINPMQDAQAESAMPTPQEAAYGTPNTTQAFGCGDCKPDNCACLREITHDMALENSVYIPMEAVALPGRNKSTPMTGIEQTGALGSKDESLEEIEIDFTAKFTRPAAHTSTMPEGGNCGFCDGHPEMCLCKDDSLRPMGNDNFSTLSRVASRESMKDVKPTVKNGPGSCADCQANPRMREWCQGVARIAQLRAEATPPRSRRNSARSISLDIMEPKVESCIDHNTAMTSFKGGRSIGCSEAFKLLDGRVPMDLDNDGMDWRNLKPVENIKMHHNGRSDSFTMEPGTYSAMELDASSILTTLQHSRHPLEPRPSDGAYASLVRKAEEQRRATLSPMTGPDSPAGLASISSFNMSK